MITFQVMKEMRLLLYIFLGLIGIWPRLVIAEGFKTSSMQPVAVNEEEVLPDAMQYLRKGPDINFVTLRDPFSSFLAEAAERAGRQKLAQKAILASRKREPLEAYDLSALKLVAILSMGEDKVAMIEDTTGQGFTVRKGNYLGKDNGHIDRITDSDLTLTEKIFNPAGDIVDRKVTMTLKEVNQPGSEK